MARPSDHERRGIEQRRAHYQRQRDEAAEREKAIALRVERIVDDSLAKSKDAAGKIPELPDLLEELEQARLLTMGASQPAAATQATMAKAKLLGLIIDKAQAMVGTPGEYAAAQSEDQIRADILERVGSKGLKRFTQFVE
jgi:beta-phosphoglucomutase-like phosphatase (HAD superfamily)